MSFEILYTSAPEGLRKGSQGFCTVVSTRGIPKTLAERMEMRSGYPHPFSPGDPRNPVNYSHVLLAVGGTTYHLLSRVADFGYDYSRRSNKLAHHVALLPQELTSGGPAWTLLQAGFCETAWSGKVRLIENGRTPSPDPCSVQICRAWQQVCGDAGWAGVLAQNAISPEKKTAYVIFKPGQDMLPLVVEAMSLLPPKDRWRTTFSTYYTKLQSVESIQWCFVIDGSQEADSARRDPRVLTIDLCTNLGRAPESPYVELARTGRMPAASPASQPTKSQPKPPGSPQAPDAPPLPDSSDDGLELYHVAPPEIAPPPIEQGPDLSVCRPSIRGTRKGRSRSKQYARPWWYWLVSGVLTLFALFGVYQVLVLSGVIPSVINRGPSPQTSRKPPKSQNPSPSPRGQSQTSSNTSSNTTNQQNHTSGTHTGGTDTGENGTGKTNQNTHENNPDNQSGDPSEHPTPSTTHVQPDTSNTTEPFVLRWPKGPVLSLPEVSRSISSSHSETELCPLSLEHPEKLRIHLLGWESLVRNTSEGKYVIDPPDDTFKFAVYYEASTNQGNITDPKKPLGYFKLDSGKLLFAPRYVDSYEGRYEIFRCCVLQFSYENERSRLYRLRDCVNGTLVRGYEEQPSWTFRLPYRKTFRLEWYDDAPYKNKLPIEAVTKMKIDFEDGESFGRKKPFLLAFSAKDKKDKPSITKDLTEKIHFILKPLDASAPLQLEIDAGSVAILFDKNMKMPVKFETISMTKTILKDEVALSLFDSKNYKRVGDTRKNIDQLLNEEAELIKKEEVPKTRTYIDQMETVKLIHRSCNRWLEMADKLQNDFGKKNAKAKIKATLFIEFPVNGKMIKTELATFTTENKDPK